MNRPKTLRSFYRVMSDRNIEHLFNVDYKDPKICVKFDNEQTKDTEVVL